MKILVITQKVDEQDAVLGFFHRWLKEFSKHFEFVTVVTLEKGKCHLPSNVKVLSLGKERRKNRLTYILNFYKYMWSERKNYDAVFVHMNQEYVLLGWKFWKLWGKKMYLWRNHKTGNWLTSFAVFVSDKVFCTSKGSFTARFKKTTLMPVGIDSDFFRKMPEIEKIPNSVLLLTRISPVKHVDVFIEALRKLQEKNNNFSAHVYGDPTPVDHEYFEKIKEQGRDLVQAGKLTFNPGIPNIQAPTVYNQHEIFVNLTDSGSFDKTIIEAMLCEEIVIISNESLTDLVDQKLIFKDQNPHDLAEKLDKIIGMGSHEKKALAERLRESAKKHSLDKLAKELAAVIH